MEGIPVTTGQGMNATGEAPSETLSLQQSLEQIEAAIAAAHSTCDLLQGTPTPVDKEAEALSGAGSSAMRCQAMLARLNERLSDIAGRVGQL